LVEDDVVLGDALVQSLVSATYAVDWFRNGRDGVSAAQMQVYDLVLLDLGLPFVNGFEFIKRLRNGKQSVPVIVLTANDNSEDIVRAFDMGADDYLIKPFRLPELTARIRAQIRRVHTHLSSKISIGELELDTKERMAFVKGEKLALSPREFSLLETMSIKHGKVVTKDALIESLCNWDHDIGTNAIEVYVHRLRKKLGECDVTISNVRGLGYMLEQLSHG
jgi:two-component system, OmpR family, response regulator